MNYDIALYIESELIDESLIAGLISVRRKEGESALMDFTLITASGVQDINQYTGKTVRLDVIADSGVYPLFYGKTDYPVIDLTNSRITFNCSNNRKELINDLDVSFIGNWSSAIFNETDTPSDELDQRLKTTAQTLDFDVLNNHTLNDINPKPSNDFTLQDDDVFYRKPSVSVVSSSEIVNNVSISFDYRYQRLRHRERQYQVGTATFCEVSTGVGEFMNVKKALDNVEYSAWNINPDSVGITPMPPYGWYTCFPYASFIWYNLNDPQEWVLSVFYSASYRFAQTIVEEYTIDVIAPQSIDQYGEKDAVLTHSLDVDFDTSVWEKNETYQSPDDLIEDVNDYYHDENSGEFDNAIKTALNIAKTDILRSHRKNTVNFETYLFPTIDLKHTLKVDTDKVVVSGKVTSIEHLISVPKHIGSTEIEISFSTAQGSQADDEITAPARADSSIVGEEYQEPLILDNTEVDIVAPAIDNLSRNTQTVQQTASYDVEIPNSVLTVTF